MKCLVGAALAACWLLSISESAEAGRRVVVGPGGAVYSPMCFRSTYYVPRYSAVAAAPGLSYTKVASVDGVTESFAVHSAALGFLGWFQRINNVWQFVHANGQNGGQAGGGVNNQDLEAVKSTLRTITETDLPQIKQDLRDIKVQLGLPVDQPPVVQPSVDVQPTNPIQPVVPVPISAGAPPSSAPPRPARRP